MDQILPAGGCCQRPPESLRCASHPDWVCLWILQAGVTFCVLLWPWPLAPWGGGGGLVRLFSELTCWGSLGPPPTPESHKGPQPNTVGAETYFHITNLLVRYGIDILKTFVLTLVEDIPCAECRVCSTLSHIFIRCDLALPLPEHLASNVGKLAPALTAKRCRSLKYEYI